MGITRRRGITTRRATSNIAESVAESLGPFIFETSSSTFAAVSRGYCLARPLRLPVRSRRVRDEPLQEVAATRRGRLDPEKMSSSDCTSVRTKERGALSDPVSDELTQPFRETRQLRHQCCDLCVLWCTACITHSKEQNFYKAYFRIWVINSKITCKNGTRFDN